MKARIIQDTKSNITNDLRNAGKMMLVKSVFDKRNKCTGLLLHIGESIGGYFLQKNTMVITELGFESKETITAVEDLLVDYSNVFFCDATALKFMNRVVSASSRIDKNDIELVRYY